MESSTGSPEMIQHILYSFFRIQNCWVMLHFYKYGIDTVLIMDGNCSLQRLRPRAASRRRQAQQRDQQRGGATRVQSGVSSAAGAQQA